MKKQQTLINIFINACCLIIIHIIIYQQTAAFLIKKYTHTINIVLMN